MARGLQGYGRVAPRTLDPSDGSAIVLVLRLFEAAWIGHWHMTDRRLARAHDRDDRSGRRGLACRGSTGTEDAV